MAYEEAKVTLFSCDAPNCKKTEAVENGAAPTGFILGTVQYLGPDDIEDLEWAAHAPVHFGKAVKTVRAVRAAADSSEGAEVTSDA